MTMQQHGADFRLIVLSGAALLLGSWNLIGLLNESAEAPSPTTKMTVPALRPELVGTAGSSSGAPADHRIVGSRAEPGPDAADAQATVPAALARFSLESSDPQGGAAGAYGPLLDRVFAPERFARDPVMAVRVVTSLETGQADPAVAAPEAAWAGPSAAPSPMLATPSPAAEQPPIRRRQETEKSYYEGFLAQAKEDAAELERQAGIVLRVDGEDCQQVAMLRALYDTDRQRALDHFTVAISTLPDVSRPEGVSVPAFAVGFLGKQVGDPAVKGLLERIAWTGYLDVSPVLRNQAAQAVLATASPADLQRFASYPGYRKPDEAAVAGGEGAP